MSDTAITIFGLFGLFWLLAVSLIGRSVAKEKPRRIQAAQIEWEDGTKSPMVYFDHEPEVYEAIEACRSSSEPPRSDTQTRR